MLIRTWKSSKGGGYDIIISVYMVYIGYDHPPITVIGALTNITFSGFLDQLIGRALRIWGERPIEEQVCHFIAPNTPKMKAYIEKLRADSRAGLIERDKILGKGGRDKWGQQGLGIITDAAMTGIEGMGMSPKGDLDERELKEIVETMGKYNLTGSKTGLGNLFRDKGLNIVNINNPMAASPLLSEDPPEDFIIEEDLITNLKSSISKSIGANAYLILKNKGLSEELIQIEIGNEKKEERKRVNKYFGVYGISQLNDDPEKLEAMKKHVLDRNKGLGGSLWAQKELQ